MTISLRGVSAVTSTAGTAVSVAYPASIATGDQVFYALHSKPAASASHPTVTGWTKIFEGSLGGGTAGATTGPTLTTVYQKDTVGAETGSVSITPTSANVSQGAIIAFSNTSAAWASSVVASGSQTTAVTSISITTNATLAETTGDWVLGVTSAAVNTNLSSHAFTTTGVTWSAVATEQVDTGSGLGQTARMALSTRQVASGTGTAAPVYTATAGSAETAGVVLIKLHEQVSAFTGTAAVSGSGTLSISGQALTGGVFTPTQAHWRWYTDASPDTSMTALAAIDTVPVLTGAQMQNVVLRLRAQIKETGANTDAQTVSVQYREAGSTVSWTTLQSQTPASHTENIWFRYADGAGALGGTIGSQLLTGTTASGTYQEVDAVTHTVTALAVYEFDVALKVHWPPPDTTLEFRLLWNGTAIAINGANTAIQLTTSTAANRPNTVVRQSPDTGTVVSREVKFSANRRVFYDPISGRWWLFTVQYDTPTIVRSYSWSGSGAWSAGATYTVPSNSYQSRANFDAVATGTGLTVYFQGGSATTADRYMNRGTIAGTTLTWTGAFDLAQSSDRYTAIVADDDARVFVAGITASVGIWMVRATSTDSVSAFGTAVTNTTTSPPNGSVIGLFNLGSDKVMAIWTNGTVLKYVVNTGGTLGTAGTAVSTAAAHKEDWGAVRSGNFLYLVHTNSTNVGGDWKFRIYNISADTWSDGPDPGITTTPTSQDGIVVVKTSIGLAAFGTFIGSEGGEDTKVGYKLYTSSTNTWGATQYIDSGARGAINTLSGARTGNNGSMLVVSSQGSDGVLGHPRALEYYTVPDLQAYVDSVTLSGSGTLSLAGQPTFAVSVALSGSGTLTATGKPTFAVSVAPSGVGSLTAAALGSGSATVNLSGAGTLTTSALFAPVGTSSLTATGTLSAATVPKVAVTVAFSGTGTLSVATKPSFAVPLPLASSGALVVSGVPAVTFPIRLSGLGTLFVFQVTNPGYGSAAYGDGVYGNESGDAVFWSGTGTLTATGLVLATRGFPNFSGLGTLRATGSQDHTGVASFTGNGHLFVTGDNPSSFNPTITNFTQPVSAWDIGTLYGQEVTGGAPVGWWTVDDEPATRWEAAIPAESSLTSGSPDNGWRGTDPDLGVWLTTTPELT